jgi:hypothetical protein
MNIGRISAVTVASPDLSNTAELYTQFLGYRMVDRGKITKEEAVHWNAENIEGSNYIVLQPENSDDFSLVAEVTISSINNSSPVLKLKNSPQFLSNSNQEKTIYGKLG